MVYQLLVVLLILIESSFSISTKQSDYYVAGVVEFTPESLFVNWELRTEIHLAEYEKIINSLEARTVDIIVFPELTLNNVAFPVQVPDPEENLIVCDNMDYDVVLRNLSCAAIRAKKYVAINLSEQSNCTEESQNALNDTRPCSNKEFNLYNTNIVFDRNGRVVARYRKFNLFREAGTNTTLKSEKSFFDTDFGVTFGLFTCFDILFYEPVMHLVKKGIKNFIFPVMWTSELPFLTAVQVQESWAFANNVNLLAAGTNMAQSGSTGSGIFSGKAGAITTIFSSVPERKLYIANVPKEPNLLQKRRIKLINKSNKSSSNHQKSFEDFYVGRDFLEDFKTDMLNLSRREDSKLICEYSFCCRFISEYDVLDVAADEQGYYYRYAVYSGQRTFQGYANQNVSICGVVSCLNEAIESCGRLITNVTNYKSSIRFNKLHVSGTFNGLDSVSMPNSLTTNMLPLSVEDTTFISAIVSANPVATEKAVLHSLDKSREDLLTFGIYSINYIDKVDDDTDEGGAEGDGSESNIYSIGTMVLSFFVAKMLSSTNF